MWCLNVKSVCDLSTGKVEMLEIKETEADNTSQKLSEKEKEIERMRQKVSSCDDIIIQIMIGVCVNVSLIRWRCLKARKKN